MNTTTYKEVVRHSVSIMGENVNVTNTCLPVGGCETPAFPVQISAATLPLPTGASTSALQTTGNTALSSIDGKTPALGQALMAASSPVAIASNQSAIPITAAALPLPTGAATEATLAKLPLAQASTTAGESGVLIQGAVTTSAPAYTTAKTSPLSLTTTGALRVDISGTVGTAQTIARSVVSSSGSVTAGATSITILSSSDFAGTVAGAAFSASIAENYTAQPGSTLAALAYTRSAGTLTISTIT